MTSLYESHHFYSVLIYFRFEQPSYAMARRSFIVMELVTLIETTLDDDRHGWLRKASAVTQLREGATHVLTEFAGVYLPGGRPEAREQEDQTKAEWRTRYHAALDRLQREGISICRDPEEGAERYISLRRRWNPLVSGVAAYLEYDPSEIDRANDRPSVVARHREMPVPLGSDQ